MNIQCVCDFLQQHNLPYTLYRHESAVSVEDSKRIIHIDNCLGCKSLFVKDKKSPTYFMAVLPSDMRAEMRGMAEVVGMAKFEFCSAEDMLAMLGVVRGNVSPFCFLNPNSECVNFMLSKDIKKHENVRFHPCDNTATVVLTTCDFLKFISCINKEIIWI